MAENEIMTLDEYVEWPQEYIASGGLDKDEICFKLDIGENFAKAREAVLSGASGWPDVVKQEYNQNKTNSIVFHQDTYPLRHWVDNKPDEALKAMQELWAKGDTPIRDRLEVFIPRVPDPPKYPFHGGNRAGTRLRLLSALLMALDPKKYPPYRVTLFEAAYRRTGYDMLPRDADEATGYEHALRFLDELVELAKALPSSRPCNRLEAQSIVWSYRYPERFDSKLPDAAD